jgi:hypothetical protein
MQNYLEIFTDSYQRVLSQTVAGKDFFASFYQVFIGTSAEVADKFRNVDMSRQQEHLRKSLDHMVYFSIDREANDELMRIAKIHGKTGNDIRPALYETWLDSLLQTVRRYDPEFCDEVEIAWNVVLAPGVRYMQLQYPRS